ncbi:unnamed protein product [Meganyctiphanes norvegica]|uniref:SHSP domain-containing protein n=1 Tax=Meganyctiphanes norvegica TaxID=48144 RepID=A0AAV2QWS7_MEGNR
MAAVQTQQQASYSMSTSSTFGGGSGGGGLSSDLGSWGLALPIAQRGLFFQDNYFQKAREHFENSVKNVLASMGQQQAFVQPLQESMTSYRQLRSTNQKEETQAVSAVEDINNYKMILDVRDFMGGDLKVNVIGDNELLVEGKLEKKDQGTLQTRTFKQRFLLPRGVDIQESSSALSSDGILTIITPKVIQHQQSVQQHQQQQQQQQQQLAPVQMMRPKMMRSNSHIDRNNFSLFDTEFTSGMLPILRRGYFNHDSFFQEAQKDFQKAVNDVLARSGGMQAADPFASYRSLRAKDLKEETQAATISEDDKAQKIVIDVQDFINDGEVNVKVVNDNELVVEGRVQKNDGGANSMKNFKKSFTLSPNTDLDSITSVVSADGVLAITVPKKVQVPKLKERKIPLMKEGPGMPQVSSGASTPSALDMSSQKRDYIVPIILEDDENEEQFEKELEALHVASSLVDDEVAKLSQATMVDAATSPEPTFGSIFAGMVPTAPVTPVSIISSPMSPPIPTPTPSISPPVPTPPMSPPPAPAPIVAPPVPVIPVAPPAPPTPVSPPPPPQRAPAQDPARQAIINQLKNKKPSEPGQIRFPRAHGYVPVVKKGDFETDPHFENDKPDYNSAVKTALQCKGIEAAPGEEVATYKKMRKQSPDDEDVAFHFSEHNQGYKIVVDMEDYNVKEPEIQIHGDNDLVIVGVAERKDEDGEPIHFRRQFVFPKSVNMEAITSAVSSDGVLTVKAPFKVARVTRVNTTEPSEPIEEDEIPSGVPLNMLVGTFLDIENRPESFDKDPMFQEPKCHYPSAIRAAIKRSGVAMGDGETEAQCYRRIRDNEKTHKNQAVMTIEGDDYYKVIVDMEDYLNTEIRVRLLGFNTFVVECYSEKNGKYKRIWSRQFILPNHIQMEKMTAALSPDGRLVMNVPKRVWKHVGNTDASGIMRVGWMKSYPDDRVFTSDSCKSGVTTPFKTLPFKGLRDW